MKTLAELAAANKRLTKRFELVFRERKQVEIATAYQIRRLQERVAELEKLLKIHRDNLDDAWVAMEMIRDILETLGPVGCLISGEASNGIHGPDFVGTATGLVDGIVKTLETEHRTCSRDRAEDGSNAERGGMD